MREADRERLVAAARAVMAESYSPYSGYPVGAAVLTDGGEIFTGTNVENASYPLSLCAERAAVAAAVSAGRRGLVAVAVATRGEEPGTPCGGCRQVLAEFNPAMTVLVVGQTDSVHTYRLDDLLPHAFTPRVLPHE
jgi:cytidine deaminase